MMILAVIVAGYLLGSLPTGLLVIRALSGVDIRERGSGNIGAVNVFRVGGLPTAVAVLVVDLLKGTAAVLLGRRWGLSEVAAVLGGLAAIAGHNWSVFLRFRGGKGIATSFGVLLVLSPAAGLIAALVWAAAVGITRYASVGSLLAVASAPAVMWWRREPSAHVLFGVLALAFAIYRHRGNIVRLLAGTELRITDKIT